MDIKEDVLIKCDYNFEVEAISNILKNEVEYSKEFGKIDITVNDNKLYTTLIIKDYGIGISEKDLKNAIIKNLKDFILEVGKDFTFIGDEYRVQVGNHDFFIDL